MKLANYYTSHDDHMMGSFLWMELTQCAKWPKKQSVGVYFWQQFKSN